MRAFSGVLRKSNRSNRSNRIVFALASMLVIFLLASLSACTPKNQAVGDTGRSDDIVHDGIDVEDIKLFIVGSRQAALDSKLLHLCEKFGLKASYASIADVKNANFASQEAVKDASNQPVSMILINNINVDGVDRVDSSAKSNAGGAHVDLQARKAWVDALKYARSAGIPVVLVNPKNPPKDCSLFAAKLYILKDLDGQDLFDVGLIKGDSKGDLKGDSKAAFNGDFRNHLSCVEKSCQKSHIKNCGKIQHSSLLKIVQSVIDNTPHGRDVVINDKG